MGAFSFDKFYPVLIDVSGDGVPLLLLVEKYDMYGWDIHWNILFGFADGVFQRITPFHTGIGIATVEMSVYSPLYGGMILAEQSPCTVFKTEVLN